jgi:NADH-quinone oxidoreductase subunit M
MEPNNYQLPILLLIPLIGAVAAPFMPDNRTTRRWALLNSIATAVYALYLAIRFFVGFVSTADGGMKAAVAVSDGVKFIFLGGVFQVHDIGFAFSLGIDAIGVWLVLLTALLSPLAIAASFGSVRERQKEYYAWMLALLVAMLGVFVARDLLLFYVFFELTLIPMFFIIGIWGGPERRFAAAKFFLFTFTGSVFTLAAAIYLGLKYGTFDIASIVRGAQSGLNNAAALTDRERLWIMLGFLAGFAVKVPLFPVHTWLPLAHTEAPTAGSVILAGVLLKLGTYGLLRLAVPIGLVGYRDGDIQHAILQTVGVLCIIGIIYGALVAWVQRDIKKLVAYSSVSHLGFCVLGLVALNDIGMQGSVLYMVNHGLSTGAMFLVIGMIYDRFHTRDINELSGLARRMPKMAFFFVLFVLSSIAQPGLNGYVSEFLTILGAFVSPHLGRTFGAFAATGIILGAVYMLHMTARVIWGPLKFPHGHDPGHGHEALPRGATAYDAHGGGHAGQTQEDRGQAATTSRHYHADPTGDLTGREMAILVPLAICVVLLGFFPTPMLDSILRPIQALRTPAPSALAASPAPSAVPAPAAPISPRLRVVAEVSAGRNP